MNKFTKDNGDTLLLTESVFLDGCMYEASAITAEQVTFNHLDEIDQLCSEKCGEQRTLTAEQVNALTF